MSLFKIEKSLTNIKEKPFKLERELQKLTEDNVKSIFNYDFVKSEFRIGNFRLDTLTYDKETNSFVIIEYKRDKNFSVIDQGYAYLSLMLNNKADFILEYNESQKNTLKRTDIDWSQSKVIFISQSYTTYQKEAINFKDLPIELWEIKRYENNTVSYEQILKSGSQESIKTISKSDNAIDNVSKEIKVYTEQENIEIASDEIRELYEKFKQAILNLGDIIIKPKKLYVAFVSGSNIADIHIQKSALKLWINMRKGELEDTRNITRDVSNKGHWGNGDYELQIKTDDDLEYIMSLIKQSLRKNEK
jgi:predicted transport protein